MRKWASLLPLNRFMYHGSMASMKMFGSFVRESMMSQTGAAILLVKKALSAGITADYILMDIWFTTETIIQI